MTIIHFFIFFIYFRKIFEYVYSEYSLIHLPERTYSEYKIVKMYKTINIHVFVYVLNMNMIYILSTLL